MCVCVLSSEESDRKKWSELPLVMKADDKIVLLN